MQAILAPFAAAAAAGAAAPIGATVAAGAVAPLATAATIAKTVLPLAQGAAGYATASAQRDIAKANAYIGVTRARQTDTVARQNLNSQMGALRTAFSAAGQRPGVGTGEIMRGMRATAMRERRISVGAEMQRARDFAAEARSIRPGMSLVTGAAGAVGSLYELYQLRRR